MPPWEQRVNIPLKAQASKASQPDVCATPAGSLLTSILDDAAAKTFADLSEQRRKSAFSRQGRPRKRSRIDSTLPRKAHAFYIFLSQWHATDAFIVRRSGAASQRTQARLAQAETTLAAESMRALIVLNEAIELTLSSPATPSKIQLRPIPLADLFKSETLTRVATYIDFYSLAKEPWFQVPLLADGLDAFELLVRCDEEERRIGTELDNLSTWTSRVKKDVQARRNLIDYPAWEELVDREVASLDALTRWWSRRPPKNKAYDKIPANGDGFDPDDAFHEEDYENDLEIGVEPTSRTDAAADPVVRRAISDFGNPDSPDIVDDLDDIDNLDDIFDDFDMNDEDFDLQWGSLDLDAIEEGREFEDDAEDETDE
ncbi:hypothetical protein A4X09_0g6917 [Tilletia walkeri]|uniref:Uncharacterized protein n=1 Tax=Tilletia walkeri TaxID=117179 RepID=A0A8X7N436_9BASI|nr:hypothetical protein A4X09_0g6917 [Tilletia walkeri]